MMRRWVVYFVLFSTLAIVLVVAPWFHSPLTIQSQQTLGWLLGANGLVVVLTALAGCINRLPKVALVCSSLLLLQGWAMAINSRGTYHLRSDEGPILVPAAGANASLPGALDDRTSTRAMVLMTGLAAVFGSTCVLGRSIRWRRRTLALMLAVITCVAVEGLLERAGIFDFFETQHLVNEGWEFASFNYHANAGAFLNLGLALACGGAVTSRRREPRRTIHLISVVICLAAVAATGSRGAAVVCAGILMVTISVAWRIHRKRLGRGQDAFSPMRRRLGPGKQRIRSAAAIISGMIIVAVLGALVYRVSTPQLARWSTLPVHLSHTNPRLLLWKLALPDVIHAGLFGVGPGSLKILLSLTRDHFSPIFGLWIFRVYDPAQPTSMWLQMHNDLLATIVEWGWLGALFWAVLIGGSLLGGRPDRTQLTIGLAIAGCVLHGCYDFPMQVPAIQVYVAALAGLAWAGHGGRCIKQIPRGISHLGR